MKYSQTGPLMTLDGPYAEYQLMSQGLTAVHIEVEGELDRQPEAAVVAKPDEIDGIISKIPKINLLDAAGFEDDAVEPDYAMNIERPELAIVCYGLRVVRRAARLERVTLGGWGHEVARRLDEQIGAYTELHDELTVAMRAFR